MCKIWLSSVQWGPSLSISKLARSRGLASYVYLHVRLFTCSTLIHGRHRCRKLNVRLLLMFSFARKLTCGFFMYGVA